MLFKNNKAQSTAEYAILIGVVVGALIAMQVYVRRSLQAKTKWAVDMAGDLTTIPNADTTTLNKQYEPYYSAPVSGSLTTAQTGAQSEGLTTGGGATRSTTNFQATQTGNQIVGGATDLTR